MRIGDQYVRIRTADAARGGWQKEFDPVGREAFVGVDSWPNRKGFSPVYAATGGNSLRSTTFRSAQTTLPLNPAPPEENPFDSGPEIS